MNRISELHKFAVTCRTAQFRIITAHFVYNCTLGKTLLPPSPLLNPYLRAPVIARHS